MTWPSSSATNTPSGLLATSSSICRAFRQRQSRPAIVPKIASMLWSMLTPWKASWVSERKSSRSDGRYKRMCMNISTGRFLLGMPLCSFFLGGEPYNGQPGIGPSASPRFGNAGSTIARNILTASKYIVRHGAMRFLGEYEAGEATAHLRDDQVVLRSDRGLAVSQVF